MAILYLHGLDSHPSAAKLKILENKGYEVHAPTLDYYHRGDRLWEEACSLIVQQEIDFIVGSSMGGYFGYWLGQYFGLPQLLFNPALMFRSMDLLRMPSDLVQRSELPSWVVLGAKDEVIPPQTNLDFFANQPNARVLLCQWLGHRIDLQTFQEMVDWALPPKADC
jgi:pimeloyl-ACP methyl ester carboxylesterase